ncbi:2-keto-4-pentenoate hydratase/2-oxohepta-3-ene-1,7-dioic acid hydratase (catechol pathway) [Lutibacter oricola]|uniref:2-keto-4-pentenoate hydratase/2-oxohepta-3-ene-1,7-dioic acid hydratase (Catechol pathway) n=1 Tax=Lutibacter oricola TaxID=762486 RepID=A0A1H3AJA9_9FLAO|nr:fumarylacetoacetate hydrolase family protein [Lutibacter oricola]SDX29797.1 2-keto-4-pentenoate hydratase/2-oxohepta-3-ene-1,7-dioic acid hydratase (catechol pathway) [Lutibacter oricola]
MKLICIGRNYAKHIEELQNEKPDNPVVFLKPDSAVLSKNMPFVIPSFSNEVHYEVEVLVKICKVGKHIQPKFAANYYNEIGLGIDFTARDLQNELRAKGLSWEKSKAFDGSAKIGEFVAKDKLGDLENLSFSLLKNDELVQDGNSSAMLWKIDEIITYVSQFFTLKIGDIIFTGTPAGVGKVSEGDTLVGVLNKSENFMVKIR